MKRILWQWFSRWFIATPIGAVIVFAAVLASLYLLATNITLEAVTDDGIVIRQTVWERLLQKEGGS